MGFTKKEMEEQGFTAEQITWTMAERGKEKETDKAEIEKIKSSLSEKDAQLTDLNEKIKAYDGTDVKLKELTEKVGSYEKAESDRIEKEKQQKIESEYNERFKNLIGENKWKHPDVETGRFNAFKQAILDETNKGKGDSEIFEAITKDLDCFTNPQQQQINLPGSNIPSQKKVEFKNFI